MLFTLFGVYVGLGPGLLVWRQLQKSRRRVMRKAAE